MNIPVIKLFIRCRLRYAVIYVLLWHFVSENTLSNFCSLCLGEHIRTVTGCCPSCGLSDRPTSEMHSCNTAVHKDSPASLQKYRFVYLHLLYVWRICISCRFYEIQLHLVSEFDLTSEIWLSFLFINRRTENSVLHRFWCWHLNCGLHNYTAIPHINTNKEAT